MLQWLTVWADVHVVDTAVHKDYTLVHDMDTCSCSWYMVDGIESMVPLCMKHLDLYVLNSVKDNS